MSPHNDAQSADLYHTIQVCFVRRCRMLSGTVSLSWLMFSLVFSVLDLIVWFCFLIWTLLFNEHHYLNNIDSSNILGEVGGAKTRRPHHRTYSLWSVWVTHTHTHIRTQESQMLYILWWCDVMMDISHTLRSAPLAHNEHTLWSCDQRQHSPAQTFSSRVHQNNKSVLL